MTFVSLSVTFFRKKLTHYKRNVRYVLGYSNDLDFHEVSEDSQVENRITRNEQRTGRSAPMNTVEVVERDVGAMEKEGGRRQEDLAEPSEVAAD